MLCFLQSTDLLLWHDQLSSSPTVFTLTDMKGSLRFIEDARVATLALK